MILIWEENCFCYIGNALVLDFRIYVGRYSPPFDATTRTERRAHPLDKSRGVTAARIADQISRVQRKSTVPV
jgi:hypothetical protein